MTLEFNYMHKDGREVPHNLSQQLHNVVHPRFLQSHHPQTLHLVNAHYETISQTISSSCLQVPEGWGEQALAETGWIIAL